MLSSVESHGCLLRVDDRSTRHGWAVQYRTLPNKRWRAADLAGGAASQLSPESRGAGQRLHRHDWPAPRLIRMSTRG